MASVIANNGVNDIQGVIDGNGFTIDFPQTSEDVTWNITYTDDNGCTATAKYTVNAAAVPCDYTISCSPTQAQLTDGTASTTVNVSAVGDGCNTQWKIGDTIKNSGEGYSVTEAGTYTFSSVGDPTKTCSFTVTAQPPQDEYVFTILQTDVTAYTTSATEVSVTSTKNGNPQSFKFVNLSNTLDGEVASSYNKFTIMDAGNTGGPTTVKLQQDGSNYTSSVNVHRYYLSETFYFDDLYDVEVGQVSSAFLFSYLDTDSDFRHYIVTPSKVPNDDNPILSAYTSVRSDGNMLINFKLLRDERLEPTYVTLKQLKNNNNVNEYSGKECKVYVSRTGGTISGAILNINVNIGRDSQGKAYPWLYLNSVQGDGYQAYIDGNLGLPQGRSHPFSIDINPNVWLDDGHGSKYCCGNFDTLVNYEDVESLTQSQPSFKNATNLNVESSNLTIGTTMPSGPCS